MGRNTSSKPHKVNPIKINNEIRFDHKKIANEFNKSFCSVAHELDNQFPAYSITNLFPLYFEILIFYL